MAGLYVHIPFCASRCIYCGFYSSTLKEDIKHQYVTALGKELALRKNYFENGCCNNSQDITTIYIGGGTPSQLSSEDIEKLFSFIYSYNDKKNLKEVTFEANPDDITPHLVATLRKCGVNRVSMGTQTFNDERLKFLHRRHTALQTNKAVDILRKGGIDNISIDLIYGFPEQTVDEWQKDINHAIELNVSHLSAYSLMYEEGTSLYKMLKQGKIKEIDENVSLAMYKTLVKSMKDAGYEHYEISNFAKPGMRAMHNSSYWDDTPYIGIGAAAHSYNRKSRQWNVSDIKKYIEATNNNVILAEQETIDDDTHYNDLITTALRTSEGLDLDMLDEKQKHFMLECAKDYLQTGSLELSDNHIRIAPDSVFISDMVMSDLMKV